MGTVVPWGVSVPPSRVTRTGATYVIYAAKMWSRTATFQAPAASERICTTVTFKLLQNWCACLCTSVVHTRRGLPLRRSPGGAESSSGPGLNTVLLTRCASGLRAMSWNLTKRRDNKILSNRASNNKTDSTYKMKNRPDLDQLNRERTMHWTYNLHTSC